MDDTQARRLLYQLGYNPDDPVPRDPDGQRILPSPLLEMLARTPAVPEWRISGLRTMSNARKYAKRHTSR